MCEVGPIFMNVIQKVGFIHSDEFGLKIKFFVLLIFFFFLHLSFHCSYYVKTTLNIMPLF